MSVIADLSTGGKRQKIHDAQQVFKLPSAAKALIKQEADRKGKSEGAIIRDAIAEYFERRGIQA